MNFAVKVEVPLKDLVDSLMQCGEPIPGEIASLTQQQALSPATTSPETVGSPTAPLRPASVLELSEDRSTCDRVTPTPSYCSLPFPRIDSPYKSKGRWRSNSATFFLRDKASSRKQLSPNAPVFTPCYMQSVPPASSPFSQCSLAGSDTVWDLPGLPSPMMEANSDPIFASLSESGAPPVMVQSILQRGISNQCRQM